jgi:hypothetical protein
MKLLYLCSSVFICGSILFGCGPRAGQVGPKGYFGPTQPMAEVVEEINQNNSRLTTLWAEVSKLRASFVDDRNKRQDITLDGGNLLYRSPRDVRLIGSKLTAPLVEVGSNESTYWLVAKSPGPDTAWWGRYEHLGKPCSQQIPIRPDLILEVLAVGLIETDFNQVPTPVMRFNNDADAYMFVWNAKLPDRWIATKEVWYDRETKRPRLVNLFDVNGRVVLRAYLTKHKAVEMPNLSKDQWPSVATQYDLRFPETESEMSLRLGQIKLRNKGAPSNATFNFQPRTAGVAKVIQLDEACGP